MSTFNKFTRTFQAYIQANGTVEVREAKSDHIEGCVYFTCKTKAFKVATELLYLGLIPAEREGWMIAPKGFVHTNGAYYLGAVMLSERDKTGREYQNAQRQSQLIHGVCDVRV